MFDNMEVAQEDPRRFHLELTYIHGAGLSPLEASPRFHCATLIIHTHTHDRDHTLPIMGPKRLQDVDSCLTLDRLENMMCPFAMPVEDFPLVVTAQSFSGLFTKSDGALECIVNLWPFLK